MGVLMRCLLLSTGLVSGCTFVLSSTPCDTAAEDDDTADTADTGGAAARTAAVVAAGGHHSCAIDIDGAVDCWGFDGSFGVSTVPDAATDVDTLTAGYLFTCAHDAAGDGTPVCWGDDDEGQLTPPGAFTGPIAAGGAHTCGLAVGGGIACWGRNTEGQADPLFGFTTASEVALLASGWLFSCAQIQADVAGDCWGHDDQGQVSELPDVALSAMALGQGFGVGINAADGLPLCWGRDEVCDAVPTDAVGPWAQLVAGSDFACGLTDAGEAKCWGINGNGVLEGFPDTLFTSLAAGPGSRHVCGIVDDGDGTVSCWGLDASGQATP